MKKNAHQRRDEDDSEIRDFLKGLAATIVPTRAKVKTAAESLDLAESSIEQMRIYGKGSVVSWLKLVMYRYDLSIAQVKTFFEKQKSNLSQGLEEMSATEQLYHEVKGKFTDDELYAWLRLLLAKYEIERELKKSKKKR